MRGLLILLLLLLLLFTNLNAIPIVSITFTGSDKSLIETKIQTLKSTYFINSKYLGFIDNYLSVFDVNDMSSESFDIGGNTFSSKDFSEIDSITTITEEICRDRAIMIANGWKPKSFAYVSEFRSSITQQIVKDCGYSSALIPDKSLIADPNKPYLIGQFSITDKTTLDEIQQYIKSRSWSVINFQNFQNFNTFSSWLLDANSQNTINIIKLDDVLNNPPFLSVPSQYQDTPATPTPDRDAFIKLIIGCGCFGILILLIIYVSISTQCKRKNFKCCKK